MIVYGDHETTVATDVALQAVIGRAERLADAPAGLGWHEQCVALFIALAGLVQGCADAAFVARGDADEIDPVQAIGIDALIAVARAIDGSWRTRFACQVLPDVSGLVGWSGLPPTVTIRRCEGYAYYALYPEAYLIAGQGVSADAVVIGLRSIGTGLAALVAAASGADDIFTVRPVGPPFARTLAVGPALTALVRQAAERPFVLVDEGPGLSGSSLGGAADWLEAQGVARARIAFAPSHAGDLGVQASTAHRTRWASATRLAAPFDALFLSDDGLPLTRWFEELTGAVSAVRDLSGGAWRAMSPWLDAPADPGREARKYRIEAERGCFLLKFAGLDERAAGKFARARALHAAGFCAEPLALRHGFLCERWIAGDPIPDAPMLPTLAAYLGFRAERFAAPASGASLAELVAMARHNLGGSLGSAAAQLAAAWTPTRLEVLQSQVRPVHVDGRLHRWEWLATSAGAIKTDAIDHSEAHDLIGCQDIAWDVAGAAVEFDLTAPERVALTRSVMGGRDEADALVACMTLAYLAFQTGWWSYAPEGDGRWRRDYYAARAAALNPTD